MAMTNLKTFPASDPFNWTQQDLYNNLQAAIDVELWTLPLYLTALGSIDSSDTTNARQVLLSVAMEEMLHLELISNICIAMGYAPKYNWPEYDTDGIPFILNSGFKGTVALGPANQTQFLLFQAVE